jgi:hypothetical protein
LYRFDLNDHSLPMPTDAPADELFRRSVLAVALTRRVAIIAALLVVLWLAILWADRHL